MCVKIGAGEEADAIYDLLRVLANRRVKLPLAVCPPLRDWASGYGGTDGELHVQALMAALRVPEPPDEPAVYRVEPMAQFDTRRRRV